jgi:cobalamin biosynthesis protein CbiG
MLWLGIGCQQGASNESIEQAIHQTLALKDLQINDVVGVASIDLKAQEPGILAVCLKYHWQFQTYSATELNSIVIDQSTAVSQLVGTNSVAEAAAILASGQELLVIKQIYKISGKFITVAIGRDSKQKITLCHR